MTTVIIKPMSEWMRKTPTRWWPMPPPIFPDGPPTEEDIALARELFAALDPQSQEWYRRGSVLFAGI